jgi:hypothetical protein
MQDGIGRKEKKSVGMTIRGQRDGNSRCTRGCGGIAVQFAWRRREGTMFGWVDVGGVWCDWTGSLAPQISCVELTTLSSVDA